MYSSTNGVYCEGKDGDYKDGWVSGSYIGGRWYVWWRTSNMDGSLHESLLTAFTCIRCLTDVEVFHLQVADLERFTKWFATYLRSPRIEGAIRLIIYVSTLYCLTSAFETYVSYYMIMMIWTCDLICFSCRYESLYWRGLAVRRIQVAWRIMQMNWD